MEKLRYKDYTLRYNPSRLDITGEKQLGRVHAPFAGEIVWDMGYKAVTVYGEGEFFGATAMQDYQKLSNVYQQGGSGRLYLPDQKPFAAFFTLFKVTGKPGRQGFSYVFRFVEDTRGSGETGAEQRLVYIVRENETLFSIAARYNTDAGQLLALNSAIASPNSLAAGQAVTIPQPTGVTQPKEVVG